MEKYTEKVNLFGGLIIILPGKSKYLSVNSGMGKGLDRVHLQVRMATNTWVGIRRTKDMEGVHLQVRMVTNMWVGIRRTKDMEGVLLPGRTATNM